jgi:hypothetical protein
MHRILLVGLLALVFPGLSSAQDDEPSSWGVIGSFVPEWKVPERLEILAAAHFSEDDASIAELDLRGGEFRIGVARGRALSGDWGVSFVRKTLEDNVIDGTFGRSCFGTSSSPVWVLQCQRLTSQLSRQDVLLNGIEVHKFIAFATIGQVVQLGLNLGGGYGWAKGTVDTTSFQVNFTCTLPPGAPSPFGPGSPEDPCTGATISHETTVQTGAPSRDLLRLFKSEGMPIGRAEVAAAVLLGPRVKVRVAGGLNYPGTNIVSVTGIYFFGGASAATRLAPLRAAKALAPS